MTSAELFAVLLEDMSAAQHEIELMREMVAKLREAIEEITGRGADPTDAVESTPHN